MIALTPGARRAAASICSGPMLRGCGSTSTRTGLARRGSSPGVRERRGMSVAPGGQRAEASRQGRSHGHGVQLATKTWEQLAHACGPDAPHIPISRAVVSEVVPEQTAAGPQYAPDLGRHVARHRRVEDRSEDGEGEDQVEAAVRKLEVLGVADSKVELGIRLAGGVDSFR